MAITANVTTANWNTNGAWSGGVQPTAADDVVIPSGAVITIPNGVTALARSLDVQSGGRLDWANTVTAVLALGDGTAGTGNAAITISSGATITANNGNSTINFLSTSATQQSITTGGKSMPTFAFNGAGSSYILGDALTAGTITLNAGTFNTANYSMTYTTLSIGNGSTRTLTLGSSTCTASSIGMTYSNFGSCTVTANTAVITCTATPTNLNNIFVLNSFNWNGLSFILTGGGQASLNIANATIGSLTINSPANQSTQYRVSGNFTCSAFNVTGNSAVNRPLIFGIVNGTATTITAASTSLQDVDFMDITGAGAGAWTITGGFVGDWGGNTNIQTTTPATQTRDSTSGSAWSVAARWTSRVPLPQDDVIINGSSGNISATDILILGKNVDFTGYTGTLTHTSNGSNFSVFGSLTLASGMAFGSGQNTYNVDFRGRGTHVITSAGQTFFPFTSNQVITIAAPGGSYTLADTFSQTPGLAVGNYTFSVTAGTFDSASHTMNIGRLSTSGTVTRSLVFGSSTVNLMATVATALLTLVATGQTLSALSAVFVVVNTSANSRSVALGGTAIGTFTYILAGSTGQLSVTGSGTIETLNFSDATNARTLLMSAGIVLTCYNFNVIGTSGKLMSVSSASTALAYLSKPSGGVLYNASQDYVAYSYIGVNQPLSLWIGANSSASNCNGIYSSAPTIRHSQSQAAASVSGTSITGSFPAATTPGSLLIAYFTSSNSQGASFTPPAGWTQAVVSTNNVLVYIYYKVADGSETTAQFSQTTSRTLNLALAEYTGFAGVPTLDVTDTNASSGSVTSLSTTASTGPTNSAQPALALAFLANASTLNATTGLTNSFVEDRTLQTASSVQKGAVKELTTTAAVDTTFSWTTSRSGTAIALAVFKNVSIANGNFFLFM